MECDVTDQQLVCDPGVRTTLASVSVVDVKGSETLKALVAIVGMLKAPAIHLLKNLSVTCGREMGFEDTSQGKHLDEALFFKSWGLSLSRMVVLRDSLVIPVRDVHVSAADQWSIRFWNQQY